jgi:MFS transporter, DHA2 family, multidrug resistance protein
VVLIRRIAQPIGMMRTRSGAAFITHGAERPPLGAASMEGKMAGGTTGATAPAETGAPPNARIVLGSLILVAAVANLNLSVANVALPEIGKSFDSSQTMLDLIAVGYSLGLAASVLWFGALGDRYGRKLMIVGGMLLSLPVSLVAGFAPTDSVLFGARVVGGLSAGMAYPTTLALVTALWSGPARTRSIALWSALGGGTAMLGPLLSGLLLEYFSWGSVFLITVPLALLALYMAWRYIPAHVSEGTEPVDNLGGVLSAIAIGTLVVALNFITVPNLRQVALGLIVVALVGLVLFVVRQRRAANPLYDLEVAARPTFWVAAVAGIIVFGSLMGIAFVNQQYLQNVQDYDTLQAGAAILPAVFFMVVVAPRSAKLVHDRGSRSTLLLGQSFLALAFIAMLILWGDGTPYYLVAIPLCLMGIGVGLAGTPSSNSLTGSVPVRRVGMASGTADLQRDLGGALMTSIFGALLTAGYASAMGNAIAASGQDVSATTQSELQLSYASAANLAEQYPQYSSQILSAAKSSFLDGDQLAYAAGLVAVVIGGALVFFVFPRKDEELRLRAAFLAEDEGVASGATAPMAGGSG